jgi:hypothetical protein
MLSTLTSTRLGFDASAVVVRIRQCLARFANVVSRILRGRRFPAFGPGAVCINHLQA